MPIATFVLRLRLGSFELAIFGLLGLTVADAVVTSRGWHNSDFVLFAHAGGTMLSSHWAHTFHNPVIQAGPLELLTTLTLRTIAGSSPAALAIATELALCAALIATARSFLGRRVLPIAFVVVAALVLGVVPDAYATGHFAEPVAGLLWLLAAREARADRVWHAGALVGLSAGFELWGVLGVTVLALAPSIRRALLGAGLAAAIGGALIAPFTLAGDFHMFAFRWTVQAGLVHFLIGSNRWFGWPFRVLQAAVTVGVVGGLARMIRRNPASVLIVPAATVVVRLLFDPLGMFYYWDPVIELALLGAATYYVHRDAVRWWLESRIASEAAPSAATQAARA